MSKRMKLNLPVIGPHEQELPERIAYMFYKVKMNPNYVLMFICFVTLIQCAYIFYTDYKAKEENDTKGRIPLPVRRLVTVAITFASIIMVGNFIGFFSKDLIESFPFGKSFFEIARTPAATVVISLFCLSVCLTTLKYIITAIITGVTIVILIGYIYWKFTWGKVTSIPFIAKVYYMFKNVEIWEEYKPQGRLPYFYNPITNIPLDSPDYEDVKDAPYIKTYFEGYFQDYLSKKSLVLDKDYIIVPKEENLNLKKGDVVVVTVNPETKHMEIRNAGLTSNIQRRSSDIRKETEEYRKAQEESLQETVRVAPGVYVKRSEISQDVFGESKNPYITSGTLEEFDPNYYSS